MHDPIATLLPPVITRDARLTAVELPRAVLMRVNFIPGVRQQLGWRGVKECLEPVGALSVKITSASGVFALYPESSQANGEQGLAMFRICYFPDPDEEVVEQFSVAAGLEVFKDNYLDQVRDFAVSQNFLELFSIATLQVAYHSQYQTTGLTLLAPQRHTLISAGGIEVSGQYGRQQVVAPGEIDQDVAAYEVVYPFFENLAASFSFCLGTSPSSLQQRNRPGRSYCYYNDGRCVEQKLPGIKDLSLNLIWGEDGSLSSIDSDFPELELDWASPAEKPAAYRDASWWKMNLRGARFSLDKNAMGISDKPKLIVLTGFLGAGKTSFLNHFIEYQASKNAYVAIVQNEIGAQGLDARLLGQHYAVVEMDEGCVCCTLAGNLKLALADLLTNFQPDFVVLETTGLANPANFISEICEMKDLLAFCSITALFDASQGIAPLEKYPVARDQLILADTIVINKVDRVSDAQLSELMGNLKQLNPFAVIHKTIYGQCSPGQLYGINGVGQVAFPEVASNLKVSGVKHTDLGISSVMTPLPKAIKRDTFINAVADLPEQVLRIKGVLQFQGEESPSVYQYVPGSQVLTPAPEDDAGERFLIFIGEDIHQSIAPVLQALS